MGRNFGIISAAFRKSLGKFETPSMKIPEKFQKDLEWEKLFAIFEKIKDDENLRKYKKY